jgi:hypothetical protein
MTDKPIAPQPMTRGTSLAVSRAREAADHPTAMASATHTTALGKPEATTRIRASVSRKYSPNPPGDSGFCPMIFRPPGTTRIGSELTRVPAGTSRVVCGP